ncbi:MAG: acyltransferase [Proteobacteria bacterium]|nr:acyltransferase [Pseudomonadota bacterium]
MRNLGLDILRFIACSLVIFRHVQGPENFNIFIQTLKKGGWIGVDLFFVLSGFLIASLLFKEHKASGSIDLKRFLIRRGFKIYPAFWIFTLFSIAISFYFKQVPSITNIANELLFIQNYRPGIFFWSHTWSLAVEEHFYIGLAIVFALLMKYRPANNFNLIPAIFVCIAIGCLYLRWSNLTHAEVYFYWQHLFLTHLRIDSLCFGVFISYLVHFKKLAIPSRPPLVLGTILLGIIFLSPAFLFEVSENKNILIYGVILFYLGSGLLILGALKLERSTNSILNFIGTLGTASYSIYLWHLFVNVHVVAQVKKIIPSPGPLSYISIYIIGSFLVGWIMNRMIEQPLLLLRDSLFKNKKDLNSFSGHSSPFSLPSQEL